MRCILFSLLCTIIHHSDVGANEQYCPTPDLSELDSWTSNIRDAASNAGLATANGVNECPIDSSRQKVLMIGIDGLRTDATAMLPLPNIRRLERMGMYSYWANVQSTANAVSGPGWSSLMTGVEPSKHDVSSNSDLTDIAYPTFLKVVKDTFPAKTVAASVKWHPLIDNIINHQDPTTLSASHKASSDYDMASTAELWIKDENYDVIFVDFDACDGAGHGSGFDGYAATYGQAVKDTDVLVGMLLDAILSRSNGEEWLIVVTSDHGGKGTSHSAYDEYNRRVPFIVASNSPRVGIGRAPYDGSQMDVLPTIMHFFGSNIPSGLDGQVFGFLDYNRTTPPPAPICQDEDPLRCGCANVNQADYRGTTNTTISGKICQRWDSQTPNEHDRTPLDYPNSGLEENYCRNPDGESGAWCYTVNGTRWELCAVPDCGTEVPPPPPPPPPPPTLTPAPTPFLTTGGDCIGSDPPRCGCANVDQADYRGTANKTISGKICQRWDSQTPNQHDRTAEEYPNSGLEENYCRNPDGEPGAWCYTVNGTRWELCDVPDC